MERESIIIIRSIYIVHKTVRNFVISQFGKGFTFINNTAGRGGDVLYGGLVALGYDGDWNCLLSFKNNI